MPDDVSHILSPSSAAVAAVRTTIEAAGSGGAAYVAFSGGTDSTALAIAAASVHDETGQPVTLIHVDHGLHPDSDSWAVHCVTIAAQLGLPVKVLRVSVDISASGLEAAARDARYAALFSELTPGDCLLTAHHQQDQAETVLLRLLRGAGVEGQRGMASVSKRHDTWLLRPFIAFDQAVLRQLVESSGLLTLTDPANADESIDRVFLRQHIMPRLRTRWPAADVTIARSARHHQLASRTLEHVYAAAADRCVGSHYNTLSRRRLAELTANDAADVLRFWLRRAGHLSPSTARTHELVRQLCDLSILAPSFQWRGVRLLCYRDDVFLNPNQVRDEQLPQPLQIPGVLALAHGRLVARACVGQGLALPHTRRGEVTIDYRRPGERAAFGLAGQHRALKKVFQDVGVPPWVRDQLPLVRLNDEIVVIPGYRTSTPYAARGREPGCLFHWEPDV